MADQSGTGLTTGPATSASYGPVAGIEARPGERVTRVVQAPIAGRDVAVPVIVIRGAQDGPQVAITGGVHGAEYVGIEAARRLGMTIDPADVSGSIVVVPIVNTVAFHARAIYSSGLDDKNLNRMFPGDAHGAPSQALAGWIFSTIVQPSQYFIDLHGGDMIEALVPFAIYLRTKDPRVEEASRAMAFATGISLVIRSDVDGSAYAAAANAGIPAIIAEIGGQGVWSEDLVEQHCTGALRVLRHLGVLPPTADEQATGPEPRIRDTFAWLRADVGGLFHPRVQVGDTVREGQVVGSITDYFGNERQRLEAPAGGQVVFLVTSLAMNSGDPILAVTA